MAKTTKKKDTKLNGQLKIEDVIDAPSSKKVANKETDSAFF